MSSPPNSRAPFLAALLLAGVVAIVALGPSRILDHARQLLERLGPWAPVAFVAIYIVACVLLVPASALTLVAGALFGLARGTLIVSIAATAGATAAFLVGRHLARDWVEKRLGRYPQFETVRTAVAREGWKIVLLTRLSPVFPFTLLNYAFGLTRIRLRDYVLASWLGMLPGTLLYVQIGAVSGSVLGSATGHERARSPLEWTMLAVGLIATLAVTFLVTRIARRALSARVDVPTRKA